MNYRDIESQQKYAAHADRLAMTGGATLGAEQKVREGGVMHQLQAMEKMIYSLSTMIDQLEGRLESVRIPGPQGNRVADKCNAGCSLAAQLYAFNTLLEDHFHRLESLYQGIDL